MPFFFFFCNTSHLQHTNKLNSVSQRKLKNELGESVPRTAATISSSHTTKGVFMLVLLPFPDHRHQQHLNGVQKGYTNSTLETLLLHSNHLLPNHVEHIYTSCPKNRKEKKRKKNHDWRRTAPSYVPQHLPTKWHRVTHSALGRGREVLWQKGP